MKSNQQSRRPQERPNYGEKHVPLSKDSCRIFISNLPADVETMVFRSKLPKFTICSVILDKYWTATLSRFWDLATLPLLSCSFAPCDRLSLPSICIMLLTNSARQSLSQLPRQGPQNVLGTFKNVAVLATKGIFKRPTIGTSVKSC
jgi:hypothetical protein